MAVHPSANSAALAADPERIHFTEHCDNTIQQLNDENERLRAENFELQAYIGNLQAVLLQANCSATHWCTISLDKNMQLAQACQDIASLRSLLLSLPIDYARLGLPQHPARPLAQFAGPLPTQPPLVLQHYSGQSLLGVPPYDGQRSGAAVLESPDGSASSMVVNLPPLPEGVELQPNYYVPNDFISKLSNSGRRP
jgi:hypothetical protein